jgi:uncharacterized protein YggU (UPF0235/DUF167 family)
LSVRVTPGAKRPAVGGRRGDDLVVRVTERAVDGAATAAVLAALADAFDVPQRSVTLVHGHTSRTKLIEIDVDPAFGTTRLTELLG